MTNEEKEAALEKLLIPIKQLYSEITTRGNKFCYPFIYTDADGDYLSYITKLIKAFVERANKLDETSVLILNNALVNLPEDKKPKKKFDFIRDLDALSQLVLNVLKDCYKCYPYDAFKELKTFFKADDYFYLKMLPQLKIDKQCELYRSAQVHSTRRMMGKCSIFHLTNDTLLTLSVIVFQDTQSYILQGHYLQLGAKWINPSWTE